MVVIPSRFSVLLLGLLLLVGCGSQPVRAPHASWADPVQVEGAGPMPALLAQYRHWQGTPYRLGGLDRDGVDCSGFVLRVFEDGLGRSLPRTTDAQQRVGRPVSPGELTAGDLVFFRTARKVRHVGIYLEEGRFVHASTSRGVMISHLDNPYWQRHYRQARRVLEP